MAERFVTIATFNDFTEAHILKGRLEAEGILCFLKDENIVAVQPFYSFAVGGIKLQVTEGDAEEAYKILNDIREGGNEYFMDDSSEPLSSGNDSAVVCPNCGSSAVTEAKPAGSSFSLRNIFRKQTHTCTVCGHTWK